jgi:protein SCO1
MKASPTSTRFRWFGALIAIAMVLPLALHLFPFSKFTGPTRENGEEPGERVFEVRGVVQALRPNEQNAIIYHEAIPDYMPAMTMPFSVKDWNEMEGLRPGDHITFHFVVTPDDSWMEGVAKMDPAEIEARSASNRSENPKPPPLLDQWKIGTLISNDTLINHRSEPVQLSQFAGQALAITFTFTRCTEPGFGPWLQEQFAQTARILSSSGSSHWQLLTITLDPAHDTPELLNAHAHDLPSQWQFLTAAPETIERLAQQAGVVHWTRHGKILHNLRTVIVSPDGRVRKTLKGNDWAPDDLASSLSPELP